MIDVDETQGEGQSGNESLEVEVRFCLDGRALQKRSPDQGHDQAIDDVIIPNIQQAGPSSSTVQMPRAYSVPEILSEALVLGAKSDLTLVLGRKREKVPVHMDVLAFRSTKFEEKFKDLPLTGTELVLPNVNPKVFKALLYYIYTDDMRKCTLRHLELLELWDLAEEYKLPYLIEDAVNRLRSRFKPQNIIQIYRKAITYGKVEIEHPAFNYMLKHGHFLLTKGDEFLKLSSTIFCKLLESDNLACSELEVFQAAIRWGTATSKKSSGNYNQPVVQPKALRTVLNQIIPLIRFPLMTATDISEFVAPSEVLTTVELVELYNFICAPITKKPPIGIFKATPRTSTFDVSQSTTSMTEGRKKPRNIAKIKRGASNGTTIQQSPVGNNYSTTIDDPRNGEKITNDLRHCLSKDSEPVPSTSTAAVLAVKNGKPKVTFKTGNAVENQMQNGNGLDGDSDSSDDIQFARVEYKKDCEEKSWDEYVNRWAKTSKTIRESTGSIMLENYKVLNLYSNVYLPILKDINMDLKITLEDGFKRFEKLFDIKRFVLFGKFEQRKWKLEELWDMKITINIIVNGVTMVRINQFEKELTLSFRNDSEAIMSGLNKSDQLLKLNLIGTDIPAFDGFPTRWLKEVLLYHVRRGPALIKVSDFVRKCPNLEEFSCWSVLTGNENFPTADLTKDFISGDKLTRLALSRFVITFVPKTVKSNLTELYLDCCAWSTNFGSYIHLIFPALKKVAIKMYGNKTHRWNNDYPNLVTHVVTVRVLVNLMSLKDIQWIRIWGLDWQERHNAGENSSPRKNLRTSVSPITDDEMVISKSLLSGLGLREGVYNFILEKNPGDDTWKGQELNENEPKEDDTGFWDLMDQLEFEQFQLHKVYKDYKVFQNNFCPL